MGPPPRETVQISDSVNICRGNGGMKASILYITHTPCSQWLYFYFDVQKININEKEESTKTPFHPKLTSLFTRAMVSRLHFFINLCPWEKIKKAFILITSIDECWRGTHPRLGEPEGVAGEGAAAGLGEVDKHGVLVFQNHLLPTGREHVGLQLLVHQHQRLHTQHRYRKGSMQKILNLWLPEFVLICFLNQL